MGWGWIWLDQLGGLDCLEGILLFQKGVLVLIACEQLLLEHNKNA